MSLAIIYILMMVLTCILMASWLKWYAGYLDEGDKMIVLAGAAFWPMVIVAVPVALLGFIARVYLDHKHNGIRLNIKPLFAWYDGWVGAYYDRKAKKLYIFLLPCLGLVFFYTCPGENGDDDE